MRFWCAATAVVVLVASGGFAQHVTVSAAVSLKEVLTEIADTYQRESGWDVQLNFGATGHLLAQIRQGAPVDVFIAAADEQMDQAEALRLVDPATRRIVARNQLVLVIPADSALGIDSFDDLAGSKVKRIAVGEPRTVPAGTYAMQALDHLHLTDQVRDRLIHAASVRQVLDYVARGEVDAGIVYATDARSNSSVRFAARAEASWHQPIRYTATAVVASKNPRVADSFCSYLVRPAAQRIFAEHGFAATAAQATVKRSRESLWPAVMLSLRVTLVATGLVAAVGIPLAFVMARVRFRGQSILEGILIVPLVLPPTVVGYFILVLLGARGPIGSMLQRIAGYSVLFNWHGAVIASAAVALPLLYLPAKAAFATVERELEDTARLLGASPMRMFWHVSLPLARRGIASGMLLAFARALGEFGATMMVLGDLPGRQTLPISIYDDYVSGDLMAATPGVIALTSVSLLVILLYNRSPLGKRD